MHIRFASVFQHMVRVSPMCAICEFVMKQLESMLEDQATEVGYVLLNLSIMAIKIDILSTVCWCSKFDSFVKLIHFFVSGGGDSSCGEGVHISALHSEWPV